MFKIEPNTVVSVCRVDDQDRQWRAHVTRKPLRFNAEYRTADVHGSSGAAVFKEGDWLILTRRDKCH